VIDQPVILLITGEKMDFITIDFETATKKPESAIAVCMVWHHNYQPYYAYYSLIRPPRLYIRPDFTEIHGLTVDDVKNEPDFGYLWRKEIISGYRGRTLVAAHNASFDMKVLKAVLEWYKLPIPELSYFCTLDLARKAWPKLKSHALDALAKKFKINFNHHHILDDTFIREKKINFTHHNALYDALVCGKLLEIASEEFVSGKGIEALLEYMGVEIKCLA